MPWPPESATGEGVEIRAAQPPAARRYRLQLGHAGEGVEIFAEALDIAHAKNASIGPRR